MQVFFCCCCIVEMSFLLIIIVIIVIIIILVFTWNYYTSINFTTLKVFKKDKWRFLLFFLSFNCNFVTAFHFHHKAAKLNNAGLIFQHFIYVAFTGIQEHLNVICDPFDQRRPGLFNKTPERGPIWDDQRG